VPPPEQSNYSARSGDVDRYVWQHRDFLIVYAAGNSGAGNAEFSVGSPSTNKNGLSIGSSRTSATSTNDNNISSFSSRGWTSDGRIKPDLMVPGCNSAATSNGTVTGTVNCGAGGGCGTSFASPTAVGAALLTRQHFVDGFYPSGTRTLADDFTPSAALLKATLINSAVSMTGADNSGGAITPIPSNEQGWGRIQLDRAMFFAGGARKLFVDDRFAANFTERRRFEHVECRASRQRSRSFGERACGDLSGKCLSGRRVDHRWRCGPSQQCRVGSLGKPGGGNVHARGSALFHRAKRAGFRARRHRQLAERGWIDGRRHRRCGRCRSLVAVDAIIDAAIDVVPPPDASNDGDPGTPDAGDAAPGSDAPDAPGDGSPPTDTSDAGASDAPSVDAADGDSGGRDGADAQTADGSDSAVRDAADASRDEPFADAGLPDTGVPARDAAVLPDSGSGAPDTPSDRRDADADARRGDGASADGSVPPQDGDDSGCNCSVGRRAPPPFAAVILLALAMGRLGTRRRRR
jgi:MYXO-CTERM domain-containing protein